MSRHCEECESHRAAASVFAKDAEDWKARALRAEFARDTREDLLQSQLSAANKRVEELLNVVRAARNVGMLRPHDGSQLDEDLEGLLLVARAALSISGTEKGLPRPAHSRDAGLSRGPGESTVTTPCLADAPKGDESGADSSGGAFEPEPPRAPLGRVVFGAPTPVGPEDFVEPYTEIQSTHEGLKCPPGESAVGTGQQAAAGANVTPDSRSTVKSEVESAASAAGRQPAGPGTGERVGREPSPMAEAPCVCGHCDDYAPISTQGPVPPEPMPSSEPMRWTGTQVESALVAMYEAYEASGCWSLSKSIPAFWRSLRGNGGAK